MPEKDITKNYIRERQFNPIKCKKGSFRMKIPCVDKNKCEIKLVLCNKKGDKKQSVQSILTKR